MDPLAWFFALLAAVIFVCGALCIRARDARIARLQRGNAQLLDRIAWDAQELAMYRRIVEQRTFGRPPATDWQMPELNQERNLN